MFDYYQLYSLFNSLSYFPHSQDEILQEFFDLFKAGTKKYPDLTFEKFKEEYIMMTYVLYTYFVAMGAAIWKAATMDHDGGSGASLGPPHGVGSGAIKYSNLPETEKRKRYWWCASFNNFRSNFKQYNQYELLQSLAQEDPDFKAAFDITAPKGCPWPRGDDGSWTAVDIATAQALSQGALTDAKAGEIKNGDGNIEMKDFVAAVVPSWSLLYSIYPDGIPKASSTKELTDEGAKVVTIADGANATAAKPEEPK